MLLLKQQAANRLFKTLLLFYHRKVIKTCRTKFFRISEMFFGCRRYFRGRNVYYDSDSFITGSNSLVAYKRRSSPDGGFFYTKNKYRITLNVFNILDKYLFSGSYSASPTVIGDWSTSAEAYYYQAEPPRNVRLSITYSF